MKPLTWFDRLTLVLDRLPEERLVLVRDVVDALVTKRRRHRVAAYPDLHTAIADTAYLGRARRG